MTRTRAANTQSSLQTRTREASTHSSLLLWLNVCYPNLGCLPCQSKAPFSAFENQETFWRLFTAANECEQQGPVSSRCIQRLRGHTLPSCYPPMQYGKLYSPVWPSEWLRGYSQEFLSGAWETRIHIGSCGLSWCSRAKACRHGVVHGVWTYWQSYCR